MQEIPSFFVKSSGGEEEDAWVKSVYGSYKQIILFTLLAYPS